MSRPKSTSKYVPVPKIPEDLQTRYAMVQAVLSGQMDMGEAARRLGLTRVQMQSLVHLAEHAIAEAITPKPSGRPPKESKKTDKELEKLQKENARLQTQVQSLEHAVGVLADHIGSTRSRRKRSKKGEPSSSEDDARDRLRAAEVLMRRGLSQRLAAKAVRCSESTLRRWLERSAAGETLAMRRGPGPKRPPNSEVRAAVCELVRESKGMMGAEPLAKAVEEVSRRQAAAIKAEELRQMERERKQAAARVRVSVPGVMRGFDEVHGRTTEGSCLLLESTDAAVPYRLHNEILDRCDEQAVIEFFQADFAKNGVPLVLRLDRASWHLTPAVLAFLEEKGVLVLLGPAHYPRYYGQNERQNREHRVWLDSFRLGTREELKASLPAMEKLLNERWPRRSLNWRTPADVWSERPAIEENREELRDEVHRLASRIAAHQGIDPEHAHNPRHLAMRLAIEKTLQRRGYLSCEPGARC